MGWGGGGGMEVLRYRVYRIEAVELGLRVYLEGRET